MLDLRQPAAAGITVVDLAGRTLMTHTVQQGLHLDHTLDLSALPTGLYLLQIYLPGGVLRQQVVKW
jgi:hypothetical protein